MFAIVDDKVRREDDFYFTSYVISANLVITVVITAVADWWLPNHFQCSIWWVLLAAFVVFGQDALRLRHCIVKHSKKLLNEAQRRNTQ